MKIIFHMSLQFYPLQKRSSRIDINDKVRDDSPQYFQADGPSDINLTVRVVRRCEIVLMYEEHHHKREKDQHQLHPLENLLSQEGYLGIPLKFRAGVEKHLNFRYNFAQTKVSPHNSLVLNIPPILLVEYLLKVHALLIRPREQYLDHHDEVEQHGGYLQGEEYLEVDPFVFEAEVDQQKDEQDTHEDVHEHVEPIEGLLDGGLQIEDFVVEGLLYGVAFAQPACDTLPFRTIQILLIDFIRHRGLHSLPLELRYRYRLIGTIHDHQRFVSDFSEGFGNDKRTVDTVSTPFLAAEATNKQGSSQVIVHVNDNINPIRSQYSEKMQAKDTTERAEENLGFVDILLVLGETLIVHNTFKRRQFGFFQGMFVRDSQIGSFGTFQTLALSPYLLVNISE